MEPFVKHGVMWDHDGVDRNWGYIWRVLRAPKNGSPMTVTMLSPDFLGTWTHYNGSRTMPCLRSECEYCARNWAPERHAYFCAWDHALDLRVMCEVTARGENMLKKMRSPNRTLRGLILRLQRTNKRENGPVNVVALGREKDEKPLADYGDIVDIMSTVWKLKRLPLLELPADAVVPMKKTGTDDAKAIVLPETAFQPDHLD